VLLEEARVFAVRHPARSPHLWGRAIAVALATSAHLRQGLCELEVLTARSAPPQIGAATSLTLAAPSSRDPSIGFG
jgi:hypothetical protein